MVDLVLGIVLLAIVGKAVFYIWKEKKKGVRCIGCPAAGNCTHACGGDYKSHENHDECGFHTDTKNNCKE